VRVQGVTGGEPFGVGDVDPGRAFPGRAEAGALDRVVVGGARGCGRGAWLEGEVVVVGHGLLVDLDVQPDPGRPVGIGDRRVGEGGDHVADREGIGLVQGHVVDLEIHVLVVDIGILADLDGAVLVDVVEPQIHRAVTIAVDSGGFPVVA
jgi:hypothetical protein